MTSSPSVSPLSSLVSVMTDFQPKFASHSSALSLLIHLIFAKHFQFKYHGKKSSRELVSSNISNFPLVSLIPADWTDSNQDPREFLTFMYTHFNFPRQEFTLQLATVQEDLNVHFIAKDQADFKDKTGDGEPLEPLCALSTNIQVDRSLHFTTSILWSNYVDVNAPLSDYANLFVNVDSLVQIFSKDIFESITTSKASTEQTQQKRQDAVDLFTQRQTTTPVVNQVNRGLSSLKPPVMYQGVGVGGWGSTMPHTNDGNENRHATNTNSIGSYASNEYHTFHRPPVRPTITGNFSTDLHPYRRSYHPETAGNLFGPNQFHTPSYCISPRYSSYGPLPSMGRPDFDELHPPHSSSVHPSSSNSFVFFPPPK